MIIVDLRALALDPSFHHHHYDHHQCHHDPCQPEVLGHRGHVGVQEQARPRLSLQPGQKAENREPGERRSLLLLLWQ